MSRRIQRVGSVNFFDTFFIFGRIGVVSKLLTL
jgi:hypothetical protein